MSCKPPPSTEAPWGSFQGLGDTYSSTYTAAYGATAGMSPQRVQPIRPKLQHPWTSEAKFDTRSTAQDAFQGLGGGPRQSCKPIREYSPERWSMPLTTTAQQSFIPYYGSTRVAPFRPKPSERDTSPFDTRSTAQDAYIAIPSNYQRRFPIYPTERRPEPSKFDCTSTSRAAYIAHNVMPYVAAKKPQGSMGGDGVMA